MIGVIIWIDINSSYLIKWWSCYPTVCFCYLHVSRLHCMDASHSRVHTWTWNSWLKSVSCTLGMRNEMYHLTRVVMVHPQATRWAYGYDLLFMTALIIHLLCLTWGVENHTSSISFFLQVAQHSLIHADATPKLRSTLSKRWNSVICISWV